jgi:hypothetical protein
MKTELHSHAEGFVSVPFRKGDNLSERFHFGVFDTVILRVPVIAQYFPVKGFLIKFHSFFAAVQVKLEHSSL